MHDSIDIVFCHGWGYDHTIFNQLIYDIKHSSNININIINIDLNFFNHNSYPKSENLRYKLNKTLFIAHSYGFMHVIDHTVFNEHHCIAINPVIAQSFIPYKKQLKAMKLAIKKSEHNQIQICKVLNDFYAWAGVGKIINTDIAGNYQYINPQNLIYALDKMLACKEISSINSHNLKIMQAQAII
jgi:hypothetical protein